ncbi:MAG: hypothetical protein ACUVUE_00810 [Candidatus Bathycorpusculaceae bacterium]
MKIEKKLVAGIVIVTISLLGLGAFLGTQKPIPTPMPSPTLSPTPTPTPTRSQTYSSTFYLLFEDELHSSLGNLTGEFRVILIDKTVHSTFQFTLSSFKHTQPYIEMIKILTGYAIYVHERPSPVTAPPPFQNITIYSDEQITLFDLSTDISDYVEPMICFGFITTETQMNGETTIIPTIWIHLSNGQVYKWTRKDIDNSFPLWSGVHHWDLTELSGESETAIKTITFPI